MLAARQSVAQNFMRDMGWGDSRIEGHLKGIDFNQTVDLVELQAAQKLQQWQLPDRPTGHYFTDLGIPAEALGINPAGRVANVHVAPRDVVLRSTAAPIVDTWTVPVQPFAAKGGGLQYFTARPGDYGRVGGAEPLAGNSWSGAAKLHATSDLWKTNPGGPRTLESAINFADEQGSFRSGLVDYSVVAPNQVRVDFEGGLRIKFHSVEDSLLIKYFGNDKYAYYETKQYPGLLDPSTPLTYKELFGQEALVRVRQSVFESDRGLTAVLGHEYYEISGMFSRGSIPYRDIGSTIDSLDNGAVNFGDDLVWEMINKGL